MQKIFKVLIIFSAIVLLGCGTQVAKLQTLDKTDLAPNQRATIVVKIDNFDYLDLVKYDPANPQIAKQYRVLKPNRVLVYNYAQSVYALEPGIYYISFLAIDSDKGVYYSDAPGINADGKIAYGAFEVKAGDVFYLGDIECQWQSTNKVKKIRVKDELSMVKKDLAFAGHNDLAAKIVKGKLMLNGARLNQGTLEQN